MALNLYEDGGRVSSAEDMSQMLDGGTGGVEDDDDIVFISERNSRLEISGFEDLGNGSPRCVRACASQILNSNEICMTLTL